MSTPWAVTASPTDTELCAVRGTYLVADCLPVEDARLIAEAPAMLAALRDLVVELGAVHRSDRFASADEALTNARDLIARIDKEG
jgi:hypothetical protein